MAISNNGWRRKTLNSAKVSEKTRLDFDRSDIAQLADIRVRAKSTRWQGIGLILHGLVLAMNADTVLEIGTAKGYTAICMALAIQGDGKVYTIDPRLARVKIAQAEVKRLGLEDKIVFIIKDSQKTQWIFDIDLLFIDGNHAYPAVKADFEKFAPWVKPDGLIVFHDSSKNAGHRDVRNMIEDVVEKDFHCVHVEWRAGLSICQRKT